MSLTTEQLNEIKAGQAVITSSGFGGATQVRYVSKVTKTQIVTVHGKYETRYTRERGRELGTNGSWRAAYIVGIATPEQAAEALAKHTKEVERMATYDAFRAEAARLTGLVEARNLNLNSAGTLKLEEGDGFTFALSGLSSKQVEAILTMMAVK